MESILRLQKLIEDAEISTETQPRPTESSFYNTELNPDVWTVSDQGDPTIKPELRERLMAIADDFYAEFKLEAPIEDVQLTGSMSNYNWNKFSDLDVHVLIDFNKLGKEIDFIKKALDGQRFIWNLRHNVMIKGHEVELYIQDINEPHIASGLFSLKDNEWVRVPNYDPPEVDEQDVEKKFQGIENDINHLDMYSKESLTPEESKDYARRAGEVKSKIQKMRGEGLKREGEFSVENLVFKKLRNSGLIGKLIDLQTLFYDKIYSE